MRITMGTTFERICCILFVLLNLQKEYNCYQMSGFFGCRDLYIWISGDSISCEYLRYPSKHGLHLNPKFYCTEYSATRCCETCTILERHKYRIIHGLHKDTATDAPTITEIYNYGVFNEIQKAITTAPPLTSSNDVHSVTKTEILPAVEKNKYSIVKATTTGIPLPTVDSHFNTVYKVTKEKTAVKTFFTVPNIYTTVKPLTRPSPSSLHRNNSGRLNNQDVTFPTPITHALPNNMRTMPSHQTSGRTVEQFFTLPPYMLRKVKTKAAGIIFKNSSTAQIKNEIPLVEQAHPHIVNENISLVDPPPQTVNENIQLLDPLPQIVNENIPLVDPALPQMVNENTRFVEPAPSQVINENTPLVEPTPPHTVNENVPFVEPASSQVMKENTPLLEPAQQHIVNKHISFEEPASSQVMKENTPLVEPAQPHNVKENIPFVEPTPPHIVNENIPLVEQPPPQIVKENILLMEQTPQHTVNEHISFVEPASSQVMKENTPLLELAQPHIVNEHISFVEPASSQVMKENTPLVEQTLPLIANENTPFVEPASSQVINENTPLLVQTPQQVMNENTRFVEPASSQVINENTPLLEQTPPHVINENTPLLVQTPQHIMNENTPFVEPASSQVMTENTPLVEPTQPHIVKEITTFVEPALPDKVNVNILLVEPEPTKITFEMPLSTETIAPTITTTAETTAVLPQVFKPLTTTPATQKELIDPDCVDVGIWVVAGSVPCDYLVKDNKYGLNRNQMYFCNRYPLTSCCETCWRINRKTVTEAAINKVKVVQQTTTTATPTTTAGVQTNVEYKVSQDKPGPKTSSMVQDSSIQNQVQITEISVKDTTTPLLQKTYHKTNQLKKIQTEPSLTVKKHILPNITEAREHQQTKGTTLGHSTTTLPENPQTVRSQPAEVQTKHLVATKSAVIEIAKPKPVPSPATIIPFSTTETTTLLPQKSFKTSTTQTTTQKGVAEKQCVDIGIWVGSGSIPCVHLVKDSMYRLNDDPLYFCNKYPLTSCCETCELVNRVLGK